MVAAASRPGLRERKKQRTRHAIVAAAFSLFAERGYSETTLVEVAAAAEISPSTIFNYFDSKVDIVFGLLDAVIASAQQRVLARPAEESATTAVLSWVANDLIAVERPYAELLQVMPKVVAADPELVAEQRLRYALLEDVLAAGFARDLNEPPDGMRARVMSAIALRGMLDLWKLWYEQNAAGPNFDLSGLLALKANYLGQALEAGMSAIESLPSPPATGLSAGREPLRGL